jgi:hypothetical protein
MNTNRNVVGWFELYVEDMERAKAFYQKTFQVALERLESPGIELWAFRTRWAWTPLDAPVRSLKWRVRIQALEEPSFIFLAKTALWKPRVLFRMAEQFRKRRCPSENTALLLLSSIPRET